MIARLLNEGQYRIDEDVHRELDALDERASQALGRATRRNSTRGSRTCAPRP